MAEPGHPKVQALNGTVQPLDGTSTGAQQHTNMALPSRPKIAVTSPNDTTPPPGQTLTGKQEHCKLDTSCLSVGLPMRSQSNPLEI